MQDLRLKWSILNGRAKNKTSGSTTRFSQNLQTKSCFIGFTYQGATRGWSKN
jgi:hypothetical protein